MADATPVTRLLERPGAPPVLVVRRAKLAVTEGPDRGAEVAFDKTCVRVGTDAVNDLVLSDKTVSGRHCELVLDEHGCCVTDLSSTNGTEVDGYRAKAMYLRDGSVLTLGETRLRFALSRGEIEIPLSTSTNFGSLLGHSPAMRAAFAALERVAKTDSTVLVTGESGTGKELAARAIHEASARRDGPYLVFDCGAASASLIESALFGHARGAFTGASSSRAGIFEDASHGTVVLDEIGELPLDLQPKLLRVLEAKTVTRVGENRPREIDVRIIACTHRNLEEEVRANRFRQDLWFRLSVFCVRLPPLRERREEIPRLIHHMMNKLGQAASDLPPGLLEMLQHHSWPGNVRELRNVVERLVAMPEVNPLAQTNPSPTAAEPHAAEALPFHEAKRRANDRFEQQYLERLLAKYGDNVSEMARVAGLSRQSCYRLMDKYGIRPA